MRHSQGTEVKVGIFVGTGIFLLMLALILVGGTEFLGFKKNTYLTHFPAVDGLIVGAKVVLNGVRVGTVTSIVPDRETRDIRIDFEVGQKYQDWIRENAQSEIVTSGLLGDKYISIHGGSESSPVLPNGSRIGALTGGGMGKFLTDSEQLMASLNRIGSSLDQILASFQKDNRSDRLFDGLAGTAKNLSALSENLNRSFASRDLEQAMARLNSILKKVDDGQGTVGALVNDPELYDDVKKLMGGVNRNRVVRNLVRQTIKEEDAQDRLPNQDPSKP